MHLLPTLPVSCAALWSYAAPALSPCGLVSLLPYAPVALCLLRLNPQFHACNVKSALSLSMHAVWGITLATLLMGLPLMVGASAFSTCSSIATAGLCIDYALPIGLRLFIAGDTFEPGPFTMGR